MPHQRQRWARRASPATRRQAWRAPSRAFHKTSRFPLEGRHLDGGLRVVPRERRGQGHADEVLRLPLDSAAGRPYQTRLGTDCETCHRPISWTAVTWNHGATTGTPLSPAHRALGCESCHTNRRFDAGSPSVLLVPREAVPVDDAADPPGRRLPDAVRAVPQAVAHVVRAGRVPAQRVLPAGRRPRDPGVRGLPQEQRLQGHAARLRRLPPHGLRARRRARTTPPAGFPTTCESCHRPSDTHLEGDVQPQQRLPAGGRARDAGLHGVPQEQRLQGHAARLRRLPPDGLRAHDEPEPRGGRLPDHLRVVPPGVGRQLDGRDVQPQQRLPAGGRARDAGLHGVPQEQRLQGHAARLRRLPPRELRPHDESEPRGGRLPDHVRVVPPGDRRRPGAATFNHSSVFAAGRRPRDAGLHGVPQEQRLQGHAARLRRLPPTRTTTARRTRTTRRPASRPRASRATRRPTPTWTRDVQPQHACSRWSASHATQACTACHKNNVYKGTPRDCVGCHRDELRPHDEPQPRGGGLPDHVRVVPHARRTPAWTRDVQPQLGLPARRRARDAGLHGVPQEQRLQGHAARLLRLPPDGLRPHHQPAITRRPASRRRATRATARRRPPGRRASTTTGSSCWPGATCRPRAVRATRTTSTGARRATVTRATRRSTTARRTRTTWRPGSRRPASRATRHRHVVHPGPVQPHVVPDHLRQARGPGVLGVPPGSEQLTRCSRARRATRGRRRIPITGAGRLPLRLGGLLLVPPDGAGLGAAR